MKILCLADRSPSRPIKEILEENPDTKLVITLGDLSYMDLNILPAFPYIPKIGIYGNHCDWMYMESLWIQNLHLKTFELEGLVFGGFEGCVQYKNARFHYTQEQAEEMIQLLPKVDVLICHCPPFGINDDQSDHAHIGFQALRSYIETHKPKYLFHGHTYDNGNFVDHFGDTKIQYVYRDWVGEV